MSTEDSLGDRLKVYEAVPSLRLMRRVPVVLRVDGKAFHTFSSSLQKPMDQRMVSCMTAAARYLCKEIQGAKIAYVQSDEISVLITDYEKLTTEGWFDYQVQKMVSVGASMATVAFNKAMHEHLPEFSDKMPVFDARVYNLSKEEVCNYFIWRQQDATRNSISSLAQSQFSHNQLHGKNCAEMQEMLFANRSINWNDCPVAQKRGICVIKETYAVKTQDDAQAMRTRWADDLNIPVFTQDRGYIEKFV